MTEENFQVKTVRAMGIPFKCVVCNGFGTVSNARIQCNACDGKGYIVIPAEEEQR